MMINATRSSISSATGNIGPPPLTLSAPVVARTLVAFWHWPLRCDTVGSAAVLAVSSRAARCALEHVAGQSLLPGTRMVCHKLEFSHCRTIILT